MVDAEVEASIEVVEVETKAKGNLVTCATRIRLANGDLAFDGTAKVLLPVSSGGKI